MPTRKDEAVSSHPFRVARIMPQVARPHSKRHGGGSHRKPGMARVGLLNGIRRKKAEGIDGAKLEIVCHVL